MAQCYKRCLSPFIDEQPQQVYNSRMPRTARTVIPGLPYHVTQRGNRRQDVFFSDDDRRRYLAWLKDYSERYGLEILAYCLMSNHVHYASIPREHDAMARTLQIVHTRHSQAINDELGWSGHLWQGRFFSTALDEAHLWTAVRYIERNPVRAGLVSHASEYPWSSAAFHLGLRRDRIINTSSEWGSPIEGWQEALAENEDDSELELLRERTWRGFPCGDEEFVARIAEQLGHDLVLRPRGRPKILGP
jgi:putative transposase